MSVIAGVGKYREHGGGIATVMFVDHDAGVAFGKASTGTWTSYGLNGGYYSDPPVGHSLDIVSRLIDEPDPGEGWRLLKEGDVVERGDESYERIQWIPRIYFGQTFSELTTPHRRRIKPHEQWTPTCEFRWSKSADPAVGCVEYVNTECGRWNYALLLQKWTCGDKFEWRPIEVAK